MVKRILIYFISLMIPVTVFAIEGNSLGPTTGGTGTSDPGTANILQPAPSALQGNSNQLQQPTNQSNLQQPATREQISQYLSGELEGPAKSTPEPEVTSLNLPVIMIFIGLFITGFALSFIYDRRKARKEVIPTTKPAKAIKEEPKPKKTPKKATVAKNTTRKKRIRARK